MFNIALPLLMLSSLNTSGLSTESCCEKKSNEYDGMKIWFKKMDEEKEQRSIDLKNELDSNLKCL